MAQLQVQILQQISNPLAVVAPSLMNSTSLYVGDLESTVTESQLYEIFSQIAPVVSIRVCRDFISKRSLGYAYVNYNNNQEANRAIELLNYTPVNGKPIRIMYSQRDPSLRKSGTANIFIKNLDKSIDHKALSDTFSIFGTILSCKVVTDPSGQSKGYGYVQFDNEESAQNAIGQVDGMLLNDKQVSVSPFVRRQERYSMSAMPTFNNVFVKNLSDGTTEDVLHKAFGAFGSISSAVVMRDADGKSKCFGFVNFEHANDAAKAVESLNGKKFDEKEWFVGRAQKKIEREAELRAKFQQDSKGKSDKYQGTNLYLKNLDDTIDDEKLKKLFQTFGTITSCKVMRDPQGQSKGSGFVAFSTPEEANQAVLEMNGNIIAKKPLYVALAQRKEERRARLQAQFSQFRNSVGVGSALPTPLSPYHPGSSGLGQQMFYGQPPPGLIPAQHAGFGYQQQLLTGIRPGGAQIPNYYVPVIQRQGQQAQRLGGRKGGVLTPHQLQQQMFQRGGNRGFRYAPNVRNTSELNMPSQGIMDAMLPTPSGVRISTFESDTIRSLSIGALPLASATPEQQRAILGEQLYPLVNQLEQEHSGKVTGMLLEMDQTEVLHLIESPDALKAKVAEAMEVLRMSQAASLSNSDEI